MNQSSENRKRLIICAAAILVIAVIVFVFPQSMPLMEDTPQDNSSEQIPSVESESEKSEVDPIVEPVSVDQAELNFQKAVQEAVDRVEEQKQVDEDLLAELNSGVYTFEEPLVVLDPYKMAPLSAIALFITDRPAQISIHVPGDTEAASVNFVFDGFKREHQIPIYGLYANRENRVELTALYEDQEERKSVIKIETAPLPEQISFVTYVPHVADESKYQPGFNFLYDSIPVATMKRAIDISGNIRWFLSDTNFHMATNYNQGDSLYAVKGDRERKAIIYELNYLGKIMNVFYGAYGTHHDIEINSPRSMIVTGGSGETIEDVLYEIDLKTGQVMDYLDYKIILQRSRFYGAHNNNNQFDWMHMNSVVKYQDDIIVSSNFQSTVLRNSWNGDIKWMLTDGAGYYQKYSQYFLKPIGENFEYPYNQHAVEILPDYDNNPDTVDILLFDNGSSRSSVDEEMQRKVRNNEIVEPKLYSRMVHYRIDEKQMTVEQIWQYGKERTELASMWRGDADLLKNGNVLGCFNTSNTPGIEAPGINTSAVYTEVDVQGNVIWECFASSKHEDNWFEDYRIERLEIYTDACNDLKIGIPANNLIPQEVLDKYA